ncbi:uncharacterized protein [Nicotiana sylvestris]|uniref:uncharacterized protein n=1 Tax=Nicotiana sylvestris TaxID=4096 RepID=UPI00388C6EC4
MAEDSELWMSYVMVLTSQQRYLKNFHPQCQKPEKNTPTQTGPDEYNRISACETAKEIWEALQIAYEGTTQVKQSKIDMLTTENKLVRKILSILPSSWESKVNDVTEAKDLQELTIDKLVENLKTYEMMKKIDSERREPKKEKNPQELSKYNSEKAAKRNLVPNKDFKRKRFADNVVKQALAAWGDSSSESEYETDTDDDEDDDNSEVNFRDVQRNLKSYSPKKLMSIASVLIDAYHSLVEDKDALTLELGEAKQTRDDLVVCVVDLKEIIFVEHKETIENFRKEREALMKRVTEIEEEIDDLLVVIADLRETIEGLGIESKPGNFGKRKEIASEEHIRLENELKAVRTSLCVEYEKNKHLQTELERIKNDLEKSLKWTWPSEAITAMYANNGGNQAGNRVPEGKAPYNLHSKYVIIPDNWLCTQCGNNGNFKEIAKPRSSPFRKTKYEIFEVFVAFVKKIQVKMQSKVACIRLYHGTELDNAKFDEFAMKMAEAVNTACYLVNRCMIRSLPEKNPYELLNGRKPKLTHLRTFGCKCYVLNNGKDQLGKFDAESDEGIFLGYSSQSKAYKIYNKRTQYVEESVHVIFDKSYPSCEKSSKDDQDGEPLLVPGEVIDMTNGKADMMIQVKEPSEDNGVSSSMEPGTSITTTEAEERVGDAVQGTPLVPERKTQENQLNIPTSSTNEPQMSNWKHKSSHPLDNIITPLDCGVQTRSKARNSLAFSAFLSQIEPKNIKEALKDANWITSMQDELHQFERNNV